VYRTLNFEAPIRVPRQVSALPWAKIHYPNEYAKILADYPPDICSSPGFLSQAPIRTGDPHEIGEFVDEWGCRFENKHRGVIGEVKTPIVPSEQWEEIDEVRIPNELLTVDTSKVNTFCRTSDLFILSGACPRPFERLQFIRGTENLYIDLMQRPSALMEFIERMHAFYCAQLEIWAETDVDALMFMDDWGSQQSLLIRPSIWRELFLPLYRDYIEIAHSHGKKIFMHSDGYIIEIFPDLIRLGLDAINSQIFCMGLETVSTFKGQITFWGEIDRQHLLVEGSVDDIRNAVVDVKKTLWDNGGCIAQCEFGPGAKPENVQAVFKTWDEL